MRILVTAGPTREYLDPVRFLTNASSGRMGYAIADAARQASHSVVLVSGPVQLPPPPGVDVVEVVSAAEMLDACCAAFEEADAAIMTAAVCDYRPARRSDRKLKKGSSLHVLELEPTVDVCAHLGSIKRGRLVIGFAMEDRNEHANAEDKLRRKNCNAIVLNGPANVGGEDATVEILTADGCWSGVLSGTKQEIAREVIRLLERLARRGA